MELRKSEKNDKFSCYKKCIQPRSSIFCTYTIKGTVSIISSDPPCKVDNTQFRTVLLKALSDQVSIRNQCLLILKIDYGFSTMEK